MRQAFLIMIGYSIVIKERLTNFGIKMKLV